MEEKTNFKEGIFQKWLRIWRAWRDLNSRHSEPESEFYYQLFFHKSLSIEIFKKI